MVLTITKVKCLFDLAMLSFMQKTAVRSHYVFSTQNIPGLTENNREKNIGLAGNVQEVGVFSRQANLKCHEAFGGGDDITKEFTFSTYYKYVAKKLANVNVRSARTHYINFFQKIVGLGAAPYFGKLKMPLEMTNTRAAHYGLIVPNTHHCLISREDQTVPEDLCLESLDTHWELSGIEFSQSKNVAPTLCSKRFKENNVWSPAVSMNHADGSGNYMCVPPNCRLFRPPIEAIVDAAVLDQIIDFFPNMSPSVQTAEAIEQKDFLYMLVPARPTHSYEQPDKDGCIGYIDEVTELTWDYGGSKYSNAFGLKKCESDSKLYLSEDE